MADGNQLVYAPEYIVGLLALWAVALAVPSRAAGIALLTVAFVVTLVLVHLFRGPAAFPGDTPMSASSVVAPCGGEVVAAQCFPADHTVRVRMRVPLSARYQVVAPLDATVVGMELAAADTLHVVMDTSAGRIELHLVSQERVVPLARMGDIVARGSTLALLRFGGEVTMHMQMHRAHLFTDVADEVQAGLPMGRIVQIWAHA